MRLVPGGIFLIFLFQVLLSSKLNAEIAQHMSQIVSKTINSCTDAVTGNAEDDLSNVNLFASAADDKEKMNRILNKMKQFPKLKPQLANFTVEVVPQIVSCGGKSAAETGVSAFAGCKSGNKISLAKTGDGKAWDSMPHEIGHIVGSRGGYSGYPGGCKLTHYCSKSSSEEFAEVFSAFLFAPKELEKQPGCKAAFDYMKTKVFGLSTSESCGSGDLIARTGNAGFPSSNSNTTSSLSGGTGSNNLYGSRGTDSLGGAGMDMSGLIGPMMPIIMMAMMPKPEQPMMYQGMQPGVDPATQGVRDAGYGTATTTGTVPVPYNGGSAVTNSYSEPSSTLGTGTTEPSRVPANTGTPTNSDLGF